MLALFVVVAILVVAVVAVLIVRDRPLIEDDAVGARTLAWSGSAGVTPQDLTEVRFAVALRGYRMEEVDRVLDDTRAALSSRDARVAELQRIIAGLRGAAGHLPPTAPGADGRPSAEGGLSDAPGTSDAPGAPDTTADPPGGRDLRRAQPREPGAVAPRQATDSAQDAGSMGDNDLSGPRPGPAI